MESRKRFRQSKIVISNGRGYIYFYKRGKFIGKGRFDIEDLPNGDGKRKHVGVFSTKIEAAIAYNKAARKYFGKFARYNKWLIGRCQDEKYYRKN